MKKLLSLLLLMISVTVMAQSIRVIPPIPPTSFTHGTENTCTKVIPPMRPTYSIPGTASACIKAVPPICPMWC